MKRKVRKVGKGGKEEIDSKLRLYLKGDIIFEISEILIIILI